MQKHSILDVWSGSEYASAKTQSMCKVCKKNSQRHYVKFKSTWYVFWNISMISGNVWLRTLRFENLCISSD